MDVHPRLVAVGRVGPHLSSGQEFPRHHRRGCSRRELDQRTARLRQGAGGHQLALWRGRWPGARGLLICQPYSEIEAPGVQPGALAFSSIGSEFRGPAETAAAAAVIRTETAMLVHGCFYYYLIESSHS